MVGAGRGSVMTMHGIVQSFSGLVCRCCQGGWIVFLPCRVECPWEELESGSLLIAGDGVFGELEYL